MDEYTKLIGTHSNGTIIEVIPRVLGGEIACYFWYVIPPAEYGRGNQDWSNSELNAKRQALADSWSWTKGQGRFKWNRIPCDPL